jgi:hypothetical protein
MTIITKGMGAILKGVKKLKKKPRTKAELIERIRQLPESIGGKDIKRFGRRPQDDISKMVKSTPERKAKAAALREHRGSKSHKAYKKLIKSIPHDLTYLKGQK